MDGIIYLDCLAGIGRSGPKDELVAWRTETLLDEMEHCGIHGALVYHNVAREYDPAYGNRMLAAEVAKSPRLVSCWVVMPHVTDDMPPGGQLVGQMLASGVRAARMYPKLHTYAFDEATCGELLDALEREDILLSIDVGQTSFDELAAVAVRHRGLPILMTGCVWTQTRLIYPVMDRCPNIHIEFSTFQANYAMERFTARYGAQRLLFGTDALLKSPGAAKAFVDYAELAPDDRAKVAGGNLARLLRLERLPEEYSASASEKDGEILRRVKQGRPLDHVTVIDSHAHMVHDGGQGVGFMPMPQGDAQDMIRRYRRIGVRRFAASAWIGVWADWEEGNRIIRSAMERYPDEVIGYATLDPNYLAPDEFERWMHVVHDEWGFKGIKPYHPRVRVPYNSPRYDPWYAYGNDHRLFCLLHSSGGGFLKEAADIAARYPEVTFLLAHSGGDFPTARERIPLARERENVYLEITLTPVTYGVIEYMVREVGAEKVLFGTDAPMRDPIPQLGWTCYARLSDAELVLILGANMERILARCR